MKKRKILVIVITALIILTIMTGCPQKNNQIPTVTKISGPSGTINESSSTFEWSGDDPDGNISKYYYRKDSGSWYSTTGKSYTWSGYSEESHSFEVRAQDNDGAYSNTISWSFTYHSSNEPPEQPSNPSPADGSANIPIDTTLGWNCSDPDGDSLTYDVYFGTTETPPLIASDITSKNYNPGTLNYAETYYWKIVASDGVSETTSYKWQFTTEGEETFSQLKNQSYYDGTLIVSDDSLNQVEKGMIIRVKTSSEYYGYIKISDFPDDLIFDYAIYENEDTFLKSGSETLQIGEMFDLDDDGINDIQWKNNIETTSENQYRMARFTGRRYIHFIYNMEDEVGCLYSADVVNKSGLIRFDAEDGNITTSSEDYDLYEGVTPDASKVAFAITENLPEYKIGDVIVDYKTKDLRKIVAEPEYHENYVVLYTERTDLREAFGELNLSYSDNLSEAEEVSGYSPQDLGAGLSFNKEITLINETSSSSSVYLGINSKIAFNPELIIELDLGRTPLLGGNYVDYLMAGFKGEFNFEAILRALVEYSYEKSGQTNPFISPSFHFTVGPVPVEIEMNIYAGYEFSAEVTGQATMGCTAKYITDFGIECVSDNWDIYSNSDGSFKMIGPEFAIKGGITVKPYLMIETSMQIAFVAGPFFGLSPYIEGNAEASYSSNEEPIVDLSLNAGFLGTGGVVLDFAGWRTTKPDPDNPWQIFDIKKEIWSGEFAWPNAPANLTATANETSIILEWNDKSYVEDGFELYRKIGSGEYTKIVDLSANTTDYTDTNIILDKNHYYKMKAYSEVPSIDVKIPSLWSNVASAYPSENQPPTVTKVSGPSGMIDESSSTFTWDGEDPDGEIDHYEYRKDGGSWVNYGTSESYTWSGYSEGDHTFEVRAEDDSGDYSNVIEWSFNYEKTNIIFSENFETGDFSAHDWVLGGYEKPIVQSNEVNEGNYAVQMIGGVTEDDQWCRLEIEVDLSRDSVITFYRKLIGDLYSYEHYFWFEIDGNLAGLWMGGAEWNQVTREIPAGTHTLSWNFASFSSNYVKAFIDDIKIVDGMSLGEVVNIPDATLRTNILAFLGKYPITFPLYSQAFSENFEQETKNEEVKKSIFEDIKEIENNQNIGTLEYSDQTVYEKELEDFRVFAPIVNTNEGISNITGIEYMASLIYLVLDNYDKDEKISDITPLENLTSLKYLDLTYNNISNIEPLQNLSELIALGLNNNQITDISPLQDLHSLIGLGLSHNNIENIQTLVDNSGLGSNDWVGLRYNYLDITEGSEDMEDINTLIDRGVNVYYDPQK